MILRWLLPLGLLGLLGLIALLIIYVLKPKYKELKVSSTMVWKRALEYRKKRLPINILNNLLVILIQALVLTFAAFILAQPHLFYEDILLMDSEHIIILDASANMRAKYAEDPTALSRFDKAIAEIEDNIDDLLKHREGSVSIILADNDPHYIVYGAGKDNYAEIKDALGSAKCSYGESDLEAALLMAQQKLYYNPSAKIFLYTGTEFGNMGTALTVVNLANEELEWNIAILGCDVGFQDNEYVFNITLGAYGNLALRRNMTVEIKGADNGDGERKNFILEMPVTFEVNPNNSNRETVQTVAVRATDTEYGGGEDWFFESYDEVIISFRDLNDSISDDDTFRVYGGQKDIINVEYWSTEPNLFWRLGFAALTKNMRMTRKIDFKEIYIDRGEEPESSGYDIYIFEHSVPEEMIEGGLPKDGIIILTDPDSSVKKLGLGIEPGQKVTLPSLKNLSMGTSHPLLEYIDPTSLGITEYTKLISNDDSAFTPILYCGDDPVMMVKNTGSSKIVVLPFSINMSNFYRTEFQVFLYNLVNYFMPVTLTDYDYSIYESAMVNSKGVSITVRSESGLTVNLLTRFPSEYTFTEVGTYTFTTKFGLEKSDEVRKVYVHLPPAESALFKISDFRVVLDNEEITGEVGMDIFIYFGLAIIALLVIEWCLQFREIV